MAVVQISRIQVRRGRKNTSGIPQLSSGEMGWAVDTQQLYIGNGAVAEGAPYVGNTEVLTEHSNLLDIAQQYQYKRNTASIITGVDEGHPVERPLQERLDDRVSVKSFGAVGDGITDDTAAIQRALNQLFLNDAYRDTELMTFGSDTDFTWKVVLDFEPGIYVISDVLYIPPFASLRGAGKDKTVIKQLSTDKVFATVGDDSDGVTYSTLSTITYNNQPRHISVEGMTFEATTANGIADFLPTRNSKFTNVKFKGSWTSGSLFAADVALILKSKSGVTSEDILFDSCDFMNISYCVDGSYDIYTNTWKDCLFDNCGKGFTSELPTPTVSGRELGACNNKFISNKFININYQALDIVNGTGNLSKGNQYIRVGNEGGSDDEAYCSVINFGESGNVSDDDYFSRSVVLTSDQEFIIGANAAPYLGEVSGSVKANHKYNIQLSLEEKLTSADNILFRLAAFNTCQYRVHYIYKSTTVNVTRHGTLSVFVDKINNQVHLTDEYDFLGDTSPDLSDYAERLTFTANLADSNTSVQIKYLNTTPDDIGTVDYWYEVLS